MMKEIRKFDLEERLVKFSVMIITLVETLPDTLSGRYISGQITRSGMFPALNYGEAQGAESMNDFIHKMKVSLKELRETFIALKIIKTKPLSKKTELLDACMNECNELISIFVKSIKTAESNRSKK
jgi:four helix bundle protein